MDNVPPNINDMWSRFKEQKEQSVSESSLNSTRLDALSGLLQNPTHHTVKTYTNERLAKKSEKAELQKDERYRAELQKREELLKADLQRAELEDIELQKAELQRAELMKAELQKEKLKKLAAERNQRRQELRQQRAGSEESNGSYSEILMEEERKRERMKREAKKEEKRERRNRSPSKRSPKAGKVDGEARKGSSGRERSKTQGVVTDIRAAKMPGKHSDSMDTLFSIPEDASFEQSPTKAESEMKNRQKRHRHVIDPLMKKLRDKIKMQREKIDKERRKELQRVQKLKKLEMLLNAKRKGKLSDKAIDVELGNVSSTSCVSHSESSQVSDSTLTALSSAESLLSSESTTMKDSTVDNIIKLQVKKYPMEDSQATYKDTDSAESSDFSNIIVERVMSKKDEKKPKVKKSKGKKNSENETGKKIKKDKKDRKNRDVFGVELSDKDIVNQLRSYRQYMTPERGRVKRDASTMYPSPITVSPMSRRRLREVLMKSEAVQTSPSVRSSSPSHAYDEVPVSPVPYMFDNRGKTSKRRMLPSARQYTPSPDRSRVTSGRNSSRSPTSGRRSREKSGRSKVASKRSSVSPVRRSPVGSPHRRKFSPPVTRRQANSPIWQPESENTPPVNSMFTPENDGIEESESVKPGNDTS